jgi:hypothetical protein
VTVVRLADVEDFANIVLLAECSLGSRIVSVSGPGSEYENGNWPGTRLGVGIGKEADKTDSTCPVAVAATLQVPDSRRSTVHYLF